MPADSYQRTPEGEMPASRASMEMFIGLQPKPYSDCKVNPFEPMPRRR
jgi:hypothetical protein